MIRTFCFLFIAVGLLLAAASGQYEGTWTSDGGVNSGSVNITLNDSGDHVFTFTYQDQVVKAKKITAKVTADQVEFICDVDLEGLRLRTTFHGAFEGKNLTGKYQTTSLDDGSSLDSGTWKVTQH